VAVNAGLNDKFVAVSTMPKTTERLLHETTPDLDTSLKLDRPAGMVLHIEFAKMIGAIEPWMDYGIDVASGKLKVPQRRRGRRRQAGRRKSDRAANGLRRAASPPVSGICVGVTQCHSDLV
jgi:hypothetical protein